ncbi:MAG: hypothetical protein AMXMBFR84_43620 [Candidatus Hydrogenedentota bacterium]
MRWAIADSIRAKFYFGLRSALVVCAAIGVGSVSLVAARWQPSLREPDNDHRLFTLSTLPGDNHVERSFSTSKAIKHCYVAVRFASRGSPVRLSLRGSNGASFEGDVADGIRFTWGSDFSPGTTIWMSVVKGHDHPDVTVFVASQPFVRAGLTGWQILILLWIALFIASGIFAWICLSSPSPKRRILSAYVFKMIALAVGGMFFYLLFHEGGHAVTSEYFGGGGFGRSDIWGIHGSPRAGGSAEHFKPWQRAVTSFAGPVTPTLIGWLLYLCWRSSFGSAFRSRHAVFDLFHTYLTGFLILPFAVVTLPMMAGLFSDGDWRGFIENVPGARWRAYLLLVVAVILSISIIARLLPHFLRLFRDETERLRMASRNPFASSSA